MVFSYSKKKIFNKNKSKLFSQGYKILMDLLYINNEKTKIFDVEINFGLRKKGNSKMSLRVVLSLINMILYKLYGKIFQKLS